MEDKNELPEVIIDTSAVRIDNPGPGGYGAGLMAKMLAGLEATGSRLSLQVMCIGHGMSTATIIERI